MSVEMNGMYIPFAKAPDSMPRYVRPALFSTGDEKWELQVCGSAFLAKYHGWHFGLATAHQTNTNKGGPDASKFVVLVEEDGRTLAVPPVNLHIPSIDDDADQALKDLTFFDYGSVEPKYRAHHLDLSNVFWSDDVGVTDYSFLVGYPTSSAVITLDPDDYSALSSFQARWIRQDLQAGAPQSLDPEHRDIFVKHEKSKRLSVPPDGLSGSPVFSIVSIPTGERFLRFDGIVTNALADRFAVYPSVHIKDMLDDIIAARVKKAADAVSDPALSHDPQ